MSVIDKIQLSGVTYDIGGGKAIEAGRGISVTTGATADTISSTLPISGGSGQFSAIVGYPNNTAEGYGSFSTGVYSTTSRNSEFACGHCNQTIGGINTTWNGSSGSTVFSVGNGDGISHRHNAIEIRQNGDIYIADTNAEGDYYDKAMIKLQDNLGGGGTVESAITSGSSNAVESSAIWSATTYNKEVTIQFDENHYRESINFPYGCTTVKVEVENWNTSIITFYSARTEGHYDTVGDYYIYNSDSLQVENMFTDSTYITDGNTVIITWPSSKNIAMIDVGNINRQTVKAVVAGAWVNENTYMKSEVNAIQTTLQNNINQKLDSTAYTPVTVDSALSVDSENPVQNKVLFGELRIPVSKDPDTVIIWGDRYSTNFPSGCTSIVANVPNQGDDAYIRFDDNNDYPLGNYDIHNRGDIIVSNSFDGSTYTTSGTSVTITWDSSKNVAKLRDDMGNSPSVTAIGATTYESVKESLSGKQDTLSAGTNITISGNVISATGGGSVTVDPTLDSGSTNPVANSAITTALDGKVGITNNENITGIKTFVGEKRINFKQNTSSDKLGFTLFNTSGTNDNNQVGTFEYRPNTVSGSPLLNLGHYRSNSTASAGVAQTYVGFRQYDQNGGAAYHYLIPLPSKAKSSFGLTTSFKNLFAPIGLKIDADTIATASEGGVVDLSSYFEAKVDMSVFNSVMDSMEQAIYSKQPKLSAGTGIAISDTDVISVSGMQPTLSAGTGIDITNNVISVTGGGGGGGVEYSAGTNINITNHVISSTVPISGGSGSDSIMHGSNVVAAGANSHAEGMTSHAIGAGAHAEGVDTYANSQFSHAEGAETVAEGNFSHTEGVGTMANNIGEHAEGWYNLSSTAATDSGSTLFSVGNGTASNDRHNALEIRKNGDIYCNNGTSDVKLQDYIQFKMVQITQAAYDALVQAGTVDSSTIYYIVN